MELMKANRTETITRSEALKLIEGIGSGNYQRIIKKYIDFVIKNDFEVSTMTRSIFLQSISEASAKVYKSVINKFLSVCDTYHVYKVMEDTILKTSKNTITNLLESYILLFLAESDLKATSKDTYKKALQEFVLYMDNEGLTIQKATIIKWKSDLSKRLSPYTTNVYLTAVRQFSKYLIEESDKIFKGEGAPGIIKELNRITTIKNLKLSKDFNKDSFTPEEMKVLLSISDKKTRLIIALLYFAGLRTIEVERLQIEDVNTKESYLMIKGKGRDQKEQIFINDSLNAIISAYLKSNSIKKGQLIPGINTAQIRSAINKVLNNLNMKEGQKKRSCHSFRHSFVQHLIENEVQLHIVQKLARHASISTTEGYFKKLQEAKTIKGITNVLSL